MTDELLFKDLDIIEKLNAPYCIVNNTLLSLYRDGKCFPQEQRECVVLLPSAYRFHVRNNPLFKADMLAISGLGNINLDGKIAVIFMTEIQGLIVMNSYMDYFFVTDRDMILPFATLKYKDRDIPVPSDTERYLSLFYGEWKVPADNWNWVNSTGVIRANSIDEAIEKYKLGLKNG